MTLTIEQLKAAFTKPERSGGLPNNYYPFWNMEVGEQCVVRFLPDGKADNPLGFLAEKVMHNLEINGDRKSVPCLSMYGEDCPVCAVSSAYYKADDETNGKLYWKKKQHLAQAIIVEDPLPADETTGETHEGKVRYVALGYQLYNVIKEVFESGELDAAPYQYEGGCNFIIKKTKTGKWAGYSVGSKFARKSSDLDEDTIANLELTDLSTLLPPNPGREKIETMLEAALTGGNYSDDSDNSGSEETVSTVSTVKETVKEPVVESTNTSVEDDADDILATIRKRKQAKA